MAEGYQNTKYFREGINVYPSGSTLVSLINAQEDRSIATYYVESFSTVPSDYPSSFSAYKIFVFITIFKYNNERTKIRMIANKSGGNYDVGVIFGSYTESGNSYRWSQVLSV